MRCALARACMVLLLATVPQGVHAGSGVVALRTAAPACPDDTGNTYVDCNNGTVTDNRTGLVWLKNADCYGLLDWYHAVRIVANLSDMCGLSDGSSPGEWRLPTAAEWEAMVGDALGQGVDPNCTVSPPAITNDSGQGCWVSGPSSFVGVAVGAYWSTTAWAPYEKHWWAANLNSGDMIIFPPLLAPDGDARVWPVRGGD